jgi:hypothetical protein
MARARASRIFTILLCGGAVATLLACDGGAVVAEEEDPPPGGDGSSGDAAGGEPSWPALDGGCLIRDASQNLGSVALSPARALAVIDLEASVTSPEVTGLVGISRGGAGAPGRLAGALRLVPGAAIEVRDGSVYRADAEVRVEAGQAYPIRLVADAGAGTYSVYVRAGGDTIRIADRYALRLPPGGTASVDALSAGAVGGSGQLSVCGIFGDAPAAVAYSREGSYAVAPLPGARALVSDRVSRTWLLGPAGELLARTARGGEVAADEAGGVYVALASSGQLAIHALTPQLAVRWSRVDRVEPAADVQAIAADAAGVTVALATASGVSSIRRYPAGGGVGRVIHGGDGTLAALGRGGFAVATAWPGGIAVELHDASGGLRWFRAFDNDATAEVLALGEDGRVVLGGHFEQPISFGGPTLDPVLGSEVDVNSYAVALAGADGAHVFTARIPTTRLTGAAIGATAGGGRVVIAGETWVVPVFPHLWQLDAAGHLLPGEPYVGFYEQWGRSGRVAVDATNRIYWERSMVWPAPGSPSFPFLLAILPN